MKKLSILLSTINDRIFDTANILQLQFEATEFIVVHQITDLSKKDTYSSFYNKYSNAPVRFIVQYAKGTGKSRNTAIANATGELLYLCDDDLIFKPNFYTHILNAAQQYPTIDIFTFKIETTSGLAFKDYPNAAYQHTIRTTAKVSIVEMVIRKSAFDSGYIHFDERFGLATVYNTGEEFIMLTDALRNGAKAMFIPEYIVQHPPISSGKIFNATTAFDKGAMTARVYGWKFVAVNTIFAIRKYKTYRNSIGFFTFIVQMFKGSFHFLKND